MMEESKSVEGEQSLRRHSPPPSPTTAGDSTTQVAPMAAIKPLKLSNGLNGVHPDGGLANKFSYWRGHAIWGRSSESPNSPGRNWEFDPSRILIDTAAPFESVKVAVNKFGGTADWKAQRVLSLERNRNVQQGLEKMEQELALYQKQAESVEEVKERVLQELEVTRRFVDELRLRLDKAHTEEAQAKQDSELSQLRVKEMEQGIGDEASVAAKAQVNVAKARYMEAVDELRSVDNELEVLRMDYDRLDEERNNVKKKAEEAILASEESEKIVEELTLELISMKETLELAQASHVEAEEQKLNAAMDTEEEPGNWEQQMQQAQEELRSLDEQISEAIDLELRLVTASVFSPL
ncbi:hypothetical protein HPP92_005959 [Vanilla planifolia]|uniref:Uncharacterized protein n=1 Tax=Vanilla planifolia TaxID=51239 RepID=A0A835RI49_VANPL|nr:hypothetical protein HPP92_005959 [Vanilla planifolia]